MKKTIFTKTIIFFLITYLVISPYILTKITLAQSVPGGSTQEGAGTQSGAFNIGGIVGSASFGSISGVIGGLAPAATQLPLCKSKIAGPLQKLFTNFGAKRGFDVAKVAIPGGAEDANESSDYRNIGEVATDNAFAREAVPVFDQSTFNVSVRTLKTAQDTEAKVSSIEENDTCLKSIGRMIIKMLLQKITISTVAWIQNGFEGGPAFIENPGEFLKDIAKNEIIKFGLEIDDPENFPFGKAWLRAQAEAFDRKFAYNAQYSLDKLIRATNPEFIEAQFRVDFAMGGWDAWTFMTAIPANNSLGFDVIATEELSFRLGSTAKPRAEIIKEKLQEAGGFLGDERCVDPKGITREQHNNALLAGVKETKTVYVQTRDQYGNAEGEEEREVPTGYIVGTCKRWDYVTPGKLIAESATTALNYPTNNLLRAEDLNDAIAAILDALLSQFSNQLMQRGFANISNQGADGQFVLNTGAYGQDGFVPTRTEGDFYNTQRSLWMRRNPNFNIRKDLTQAFVDTQRTYVQKLNDYNRELEELVRYTYQLDYCIPGPSPDWRERAERRISEISTHIPSTPGGPIELIKGILSILKAINLSFAVKPAGIGFGVSLNVGGLTEGILSILGNGLPEDVMTRYYYASTLTQFSGVRVAPTNQTSSKADVVGILNGLLNSYEQALKRTYTRELMPAVTRVASGEYRKTPGYLKIIDDNELEIAIKTSIVTQLLNIKDEVEALNPGSTGLPDGADPDYPVPAEVLNWFARLSSNFVDGNDIANMDKLAKQVRDHREYVHKELLEGPFGCENNLNTQLEQETNRRLYPKNMFIPFQGKEYGQLVNAPLQCGVGEMEQDGECVAIPEEGVICIPPDIPIGSKCVRPPDLPECIDTSEEGEPDPAFDACIDNLNQQLNNFANSVYGTTGIGTEDPNQTTDFGFDGTFTPILPGQTTFMDESTGQSTTINPPGGSTGGGGTGGGIISNKPVSNTTEGFLIYGYVQSFRRVPSNALDSQKIIIPRGILDVNAPCPLLRFGARANQAAKRSLKAQKKACRKDDNPSACRKNAQKEHAEMQLNIVGADIELGKICSFRRMERDSILHFEKVMRIF